MKQSAPNRRGKKTKQWLKVRAAWVTNNPPSHEGQYVCGLCGKSVHIDDMELDHINPRSGATQSVWDFTNLQPTHSFCNQAKGSRRLKSLISQAEYEFRRRLKL